MKSILFLLALFAGAATSTQAIINTQLRGRIGDPMQATTISFTVGTILCWLYCLFNRTPLPTLETIRTIPWWMWTGGGLGTFYIWTSIVVTRQIGVGAMLGLVIAGQMTSSLVIDHYGLFHATVRPATMIRIAGTVLVVLGVCLLGYASVKKT